MGPLVELNAAMVFMCPFTFGSITDKRMYKAGHKISIYIGLRQIIKARNVSQATILKRPVIKIEDNRDADYMELNK